MLSRGSGLSTLPAGPPRHKVPSPAALPGSLGTGPGVTSPKARCSVQPPTPVFLSPRRSGSLSPCKTQGTMCVAAGNLSWLSLIRPEAKFHPDSSEGLARRPLVQLLPTVHPHFCPNNPLVLSSLKHLSSAPAARPAENTFSPLLLWPCLFSRLL